MPVGTPLVDPGPPLTEDELRRYSRHVTLDGFGDLAQRRLRHASVLVMGAGGLGAPALTYLAAAGVGRIVIVDDDTVAESNLQRQVIHRTEDIGRAKVASAADALRRLNPGVEVIGHREPLTAANGTTLVAGHHLVLDGTDNFTARYDVSDAATAVGIPHVWASVNQFAGQLSVLWAGHGPCYRCLFPHPPTAGSVPSCAEAGVLGVVPGMMGTLQAVEAIKLICGLGEPLVGRLQLHDLLRMRTEEVRVRPDPTCPGCGAGELASEDGWGALRLRDALQREGAVPLVVDVREADERAVSHIPGSVWIPKAEFLAGRWRELPTDRRVVLYCRSGVRSAECLAALREHGHRQADHLSGGIRSWVVEVDPDLRLG